MAEQPAKDRKPSGKALEPPGEGTAPSAPSVEDVFDPRKHEDLAAAVAKLSPEEATFFLRRLEAAMTKRKIQLTGYLVAMAVWVAGMIGALVYYGSVDGFVGWVFLMPFALVGVVLWSFGRWAEKIAAQIRDSEAQVTEKPAAAE